jgi:hypothetical protein
VLQVLEARIIAHGVKERVHFDPLQNAFLLLVGPLKPGKRLVIVLRARFGLMKEVAWT